MGQQMVSGLLACLSGESDIEYSVYGYRPPHVTVFVWRWNTTVG